MRGLLLILLLVPTAAAHGGQQIDAVLPPGTFLNHIEPVDVELAPGSQRNWTLAFGGPAGGGVLHGGWYWLVRADVEGTLRASLLVEGQNVGTWHWGTGAQLEVARLPFDGFPTLRLQNIGQENATARFYYDQTCDCTGKVVPAQEGPAWMNTDAKAGEVVRLNLTIQPVRLQPGDAPLPANVTVRVMHLVPDDVGGFAPEEESMRTWSTQDQGCHPGVWTGCLDFAFTAQEDGMQLVWVDTRHDGNEMWGTGVRPVVSVSGTDKGAPVGPAGLAALAVVALAFRRHQ